MSKMPSSTTDNMAYTDLAYRPTRNFDPMKINTFGVAKRANLKKQTRNTETNPFNVMNPFNGFGRSAKRSDSMSLDYPAMDSISNNQQQHKRFDTLRMKTFGAVKRSIMEDEETPGDA